MRGTAAAPTGRKLTNNNYCLFLSSSVLQCPSLSLSLSLRLCLLRFSASLYQHKIQVCNKSHLLPPSPPFPWFLCRRLSSSQGGGTTETGADVRTFVAFGAQVKEQRRHPAGAALPQLGGWRRQRGCVPVCVFASTAAAAAGVWLTLSFLLQAAASWTSCRRRWRGEPGSRSSRSGGRRSGRQPWDSTPNPANSWTWTSSSTRVRSKDGYSERDQGHPAERKHIISLISTSIQLIGPECSFFGLHRSF